MRKQVIVPPNLETPEEYARKLGISRKRYLELKAITDKVLAENAHKSIEQLEKEDRELGPLPDIFGTRETAVDSKKSLSKKSISHCSAKRN